MWVKARHIQVATLEECEQLLKTLDEGGDFAELAESHSQCPTATQGGDLGLFTTGQMPAELDAVLFTEPPGVYGPVSTEWGCHVVEILEQVPPP